MHTPIPRYKYYTKKNHNQINSRVICIYEKTLYILKRKEKKNKESVWLT